MAIRVEPTGISGAFKIYSETFKPNNTSVIFKILLFIKYMPNPPYKVAINHLMYPFSIICINAIHTKWRPPSESAEVKLARLFSVSPSHRKMLHYEVNI